MLYLMTISVQHLSNYAVLAHKLEKFIEALGILSTGHLLITLISPTQLEHIPDQVKAVLQKIIQTINHCVRYSIKR